MESRGKTEAGQEESGRGGKKGYAYEGGVTQI